MLGAVPGELLAALDTAVEAYEHANGLATRRLQAVETILVLLLLLALFSEWQYIFRPLVRTILRETRVQSAIRRRYDAVLRTVGEAIVTLDTDNVILSANTEAERVWGRPVSGLIGGPVHALVLPGRELPPADWRAMFPAARRVESVGLRPGGESFPLELSLTESTSHGGDHVSGEPARGRAKDFHPLRP